MNTKTLLLLTFFASVAIQVTWAQSGSVSVSGSASGSGSNSSSASSSGSASVSVNTSLPTILTKMRTVFANLTKLASGSIASSLTKMTNMVKNITNLEKTYLSNATKMASQMANGFINRTRTFTSKLPIPGKNMSKCMNLTACSQTMKSAFMGNITKCIKAQSNTTSRVITDHMYMLKNVTSEISKFSYNVTSCMKSSKPTACASNLLANITKMAQRIPGQVQNYTSKDLKALAYLPLQMTICHAQTAFNMEKTMAVMGMGHINCIKQLMKNSTSSGSASGSISVSVSSNGTASANASGSVSTNTTTSTSTSTSASTSTSTSSTTTATTTVQSG